LKSLRPIYNPFNSYLTERKYDNAISKFSKLTKIAGCLPRTDVLKKENNYWKGVCRSLIFRFPDDLEILLIPKNENINDSKGTIQVRSSSRIGQSDLGVNKKRVEDLLYELEKLS
tara:strand:+ start:783 stop:1127 length:345 start_codon:yes stop_codon:yes gene_type:complete